MTLIKNIKGMLVQEGKDARLIVHPPYKNDGHRLFFEMGDYWKDVIAFLGENLN